MIPTSPLLRFTYSCLCLMSMRTAVLLLVCSAIMAPVTAVAAYYNTYTTVATLDNPNGCYSTQGFDTGSSYTYSIKINSDETKASIYRTTMSDGTTTGPVAQRVILIERRRWWPKFGYAARISAE